MCDYVEYMWIDIIWAKNYVTDMWLLHFCPSAYMWPNIGHSVEFIEAHIGTNARLSQFCSLRVPLFGDVTREHFWVRERESEWDQLRPTETALATMNPHHSEWDHFSPSGWNFKVGHSKCDQLRPSKSIWDVKISDHSKWDLFRP